MSKRHLILIDFPWMRDKDPRVPLGHASLLATLSQNSDLVCHSFVRPINDKDEFCVDQVWNEIHSLIYANKGTGIDIAIGAYVWAENVIQNLLPRIRSHLPLGRIILGGPQISYSSYGLERLYPEADVFIRGYGEIALLALTSTNGQEVIEGVHYAGDYDENKQTIVDLDILPSPFLSGIIPLHNRKFIRWESQRGCPFSCSFCQHKEAGAKLRKREFCAGRIFSEIDLFCEHNIEEIAVLDPIFNASSQSIAILNRFRDNGFCGRLSLQCRAEMITEEFVQLVKGMNVKLEFGLQTIHLSEGKVVRRQNNMKKVQQNLSLVAAEGIEFEISVIFGLPTQTLSSFTETVDWCLSSGVNTIKAFPLMLLRGTELEERKSEWGLVESTDSMPVVLSSSTYSLADWKAMAKLSEALKETEGNHPKEVGKLVLFSQKMEIKMPRFRPNGIPLVSETISNKGEQSTYVG